MVRQLTNTFMIVQPTNRHDQEQYCRSFHLTYSREHMLILLMRLMDHFPNADLGFVNMQLHKLEVINMQLCRCPHHKKFRELTQYNSSSVLNWTQTLKIHQREQDTPTNMRLGGMKRQFVLPQLWDCERASSTIAKYIPDKIKMASEGGLIVSMINHMSPAQATMAKLMWCLNEYTESLARQNDDRLGKIWTQSASYRTFVHTFRSRPRGPSYGIPITPYYHPSQIMMAPSVPSMIDMQGLSGATAPKKPRTESPAQSQNLNLPEQFPVLEQFSIPSSTMTLPSPQMTFNSNVPYALPNLGVMIPNVTAKRKVEEIRSEALMNQILEQGAEKSEFKVPLPRTINTASNKMRPPPGIRTQPLPPDRRHFPPGPQKTLRVPTKILRRKESEYERGSLRVQAGRTSQIPTNLVKEVGEVQQMQQIITAEELARARQDQEMGSPNPPNPQDPHVSSQQQELEDQNRVTENAPASTSHESPTPVENLDLEKVMEETEVKSVHSTTSSHES